MRHALAALLLATAAPVAAQTGPAPDFSADRVRADIEFLADDLLEGRDAGTRGYDLAAHYVAMRFAALGLTPGGAGGWYQQVPLVQSALDPAAPAVLTIGGQRFANGGDVALFPDGQRPRQQVTADVVFVGYGLENAALGLNDFAGLDVRGKIVAVLSGYPKGLPSEVGAHLAATKVQGIEAKGAVGFLGIPTLQRRKTLPFARVREFLKQPTLYWANADGTPHLAAPKLTVSANLDVPAATALFAGARRPLDAVLAEADRDGGKPKGFALGKQANFERAITLSKFTSPNVLGVLRGSDPAVADEYIVITAHLDHDGVDATLTGDTIYNGAMDNAAGTATMLEVARALAQSPTRPRRSILFAAVTAEEDGLLGSEYLAKHPATKGGRIVANVNLDMPILTYDFKNVIAFGAEHSTLGPIIAEAVKAAGVGALPDPVPAEGLFVRSDHYSFVKEGVPSVMLATDLTDPAAGAFLAQHYHRVSDQPNLPFNWAAGAKFARINYLIARAIADAPDAPRWYTGSFFGDTFAKDQPKATPPK